MIKNILNPLRIDHWTKNFVLVFGYIFATFYYSENFYNFNKLIYGFFIICISASANYLINEFLDKETDKFHPIKKFRTFVKAKKSKGVFFEYIFLVFLSIIFSYFINFTFFILNITFIFFGYLYNVRPFRLKDIVLLDVILESANNPLRFIMGWSILLPDYYPPLSIILFFWFAGCFLMSMKRYTEYHYLVKKIKPEKYRNSFKYYNKNNLFNLSIFYCLFSFFFFTIFIIKYKIELIIISPFAILLYMRVFAISLVQNSLIMRIEKIYRDKFFLYILLFSIFFSIILLKIDIPSLQLFEQNNLISIFS